MAQEQNTTVEVQPGDTIDSLNQRLIASGGRSINLVVPQSASVPSTLPEFEQLRELERRAGLRLTMIVDPHDRTRFGLAKILSFNVRTSEATPRAGDAVSFTAPADSASAATLPSDAYLAPPASATPPTSRLNKTSALPDDRELPADIAGMNFDADELDAAMPPPLPPSSPTASLNRPRIMGASDTPPAPSRERDRRAERSRDARRDRDTAPVAPSRSSRFTAEPPPTAHTSQRDTQVAASAAPLSNTAKLKLKAKTSSGTISSDGAATSSDVLAGAADRDSMSSTDNTPTMPVPVSSPDNGRVTGSRTPSQSKTAAAAVLAAPPRAIGSTARPPARTDAITLRRQRESSRRIMFAAFLVVLLLLLGGIAYLVLNLGGTAPSATVTLTPRTIEVSQQVSVPIAINGHAQLDSNTAADYRINPAVRLLTLLAATTPTNTITVPTSATNTLPTVPANATAAPVAAQPLSVVISETGTISTTATRPQPTGNDHTTLKIVNPNGTSATIDAGTRIPGGGTSFYFSSAIVVPASNLLGGVIGTSYVRVQAEAVGPTHVAAYTMIGTIGSLQYQNTDDASGATIINIPIVSEANYNDLVGGLIAKVNARIPDAINAKVQGSVLITQTFGYDSDPQIVTDHKIGEDGSTLTATVTRSAHAYAFNPQDASKAASLAVQQSIAQASHNLNLDPASIKVNAGQLQPAANGYVYQASASASATYSIDAATLDGVRQMLAGHKASESVADLRQRIIARYPAIADVQIKITPGSGNNDGVLNADKITVQPATASASGTPTPSATPKLKAKSPQRGLGGIAQRTMRRMSDVGLHNPGIVGGRDFSPKPPLGA